jgi:outer membrane protein, multidrug efflux system
MNNRFQILQRYSIGILSISLISCSAIGPTYQEYKASTPTQWHAALPHQGQTTTLTQWWQQFDDPQVARLIEAATQESDTLASALSRIEQSRAAAVAARAGGLPNVGLNASATRANNGPNTGGAQSNARASADASWELDIFGGNQRSREAAAARLASSTATWHALRVSVATEVAMQYVGLRACEALLKGFEADAQSRLETDRLTQLKVKAGFTAPAEGSLASASAAEAQSRLAAQHAECDVNIKSLVALTALDETSLRTQLGASQGKLPQPDAFAVTALPASLIAQRPDIAAAERELAAANADIGVAEAARYPRFSLIGSIGAIASRIAGMSSEGSTWSFGPALDLPLFDAGRRAANADAARARYAEALAVYKSKVRHAISEVEQALTLLASAQARETDTQAAAKGYEAFLKASDARHRAGAGSLLELEDARRTLLNAQVSLLNVQRERVTQWISLYRALGGGWSASDAIPNISSNPNP